MSDGARPRPRRAEFRLTGLDCPDCARGVAASVEAIEGVECASLNFAVGILLVEYEDAVVLDAVIALVTSMEYGIEPLGGDDVARVPAPSLRTRLVEPAMYLAGVFLVLSWAVDMLGLPGWLALACSLAAILLCGGPVFRRALIAARARTLDMNVLMALAVVGALAIGEHREAATVVFLFAVGGALESRALARTRHSIRDLIKLAPSTAWLLNDGQAHEVAVETIEPGDLVLVKPGARLPVDGEVVTGSSAVDEAPITGESLPVQKEDGAAVWAGSLNGSGALEVRVTVRSADSTLARIVRLVEDAQAQQAPIQGLVDRFTRWYTPTVVGLAIAIATVPPLVLWALGEPVDPYEWVYRALVLLVVSCPCALVISTPVAMVSAITRAARDGVLVKGGAYIEMAAHIRVVAFDKTGTLTAGRPEVASVVAGPDSVAEEVLRIAGALESRASHPLADAVVRAAGNEPSVAQGIDEVPGRGVFGSVGGSRYLAGSPALARESGITPASFEQAAADLEALGQTVIVLAHIESGTALGVIGVEDVVREQAAEVVHRLHAGGIAHTVMLTGDNERVAASVALKAGVDEFRSRLLPQDKSEAVRELRRTYGPVAMVGDGINDAPALAVADIGIAMGAAGSDTALETADVALMSDDLSALPHFFDLGRRTLANIRQNVWFSVVIKFAVLALALTGNASLWLAVFADTGVALLVILNGLRLLRPRNSTHISV